LPGRTILCRHRWKERYDGDTVLGSSALGESAQPAKSVVPPLCHQIEIAARVLANPQQRSVVVQFEIHSNCTTTQRSDSMHFIASCLKLLRIKYRLLAFLDRRFDYEESFASSSFRTS
jgi:hypothetical protein